MRYGTSVLPDWDQIMNSARARATSLGVRSKIIAVENSPRLEKYLGSKYQYLIEAPEYVGQPRCGESTQEILPCVLYRYAHVHTYHISRISGEPGKAHQWRKFPNGEVECVLIESENVKKYWENR